MGDGKLPLNDVDEIEVPKEIISGGDLIEEIFGQCLADKDYEGMKNRAILAPFNREVTKLNDDIISRLVGLCRFKFLSLGCLENTRFIEVLM